MNREAPTRENRRGFRRWVWIILVAAPVAALMLGNLWLACPPGRAWIAAKIQPLAGGLETHVRGASISPWNGVTLHHVELLQPKPLRLTVKQPLAQIDTIRLSPVWQSWFRGRLELRALALDSPHLVIPLELLSELARSQAPATPPLVSAGPPVLMAPPSVTIPNTTPASPPVTPPQGAETPPKTPAAPLPPTAWLHLKNASFTLLSASSGKPWFQATGVSSSVPVSGKPAQSTLHIRAIHIAGRETLTDLNAVLDWQDPLLSVKPIQTEILGLKFVLAGKIAMLAGIPLQLEAQLPRQKPASLTLPAGGRAEADTISANARFRGLLLAPGTWQGDLLAEVLAPSARIAGHDAKFDRGSAITILRGGILSCVDARLIGDDLSLLGNATLLADGRAAAALRLVAPPDSVTAIVNRTFPNIPQPPALTPLSSPQRAAFDLEASGNIRHLFLRLGHDGPVMELKQ